MSLKLSHLSVLLIVMVVIFLGLWALCGNVFIGIENIQSMAFQIPELGILSLGMMIVMLTGGINLSLIATSNLSGIILGLLLKQFINPESTGLGVVVIIALAIMVGQLIAISIGFFNGMLVAVLDISPILATLGTMMIIRGTSLVLTNGDVISGFTSAMQVFGISDFLGIPTPFIIFLICTLIMGIILNQTTFGLKVYLIGSNPLACFFSGIKNQSVLLRTYIISGIYSGIAGLIMLSRFNSAKANYGDSYLLLTILASVMGGVSATGGFGKVSGLLISLIILQMISSGFNLLGISSYLSLVFSGIILILVMIIRYTVDKLQSRKI